MVSSLLQQLSNEINARDYSENILNAFMAANVHLIRYSDQLITTITDVAFGPYFKHLSLDKKLSKVTAA